MLRRNSLKLTSCAVIALLLGFVGLPLAAQDGFQGVSIRALLADPEGWLHKKVKVDGYVKEMVSLPTQPNFLWYQIVDLEDNAIWVKRERSSDEDYPPQNQKIEVFAEVARNTSQEVRGQDIILLESEGSARAGVLAKMTEWMGDNVLLAVLLGVFVILLIALLFVLFAPFLRRRRQAAAASSTGHQAAGSSVTGGGGPVGDLATPIYQGPEVMGDMMTPVYYGHVRVDECTDSTLEGKSFDLSFPGNKNEAVLGRGSQADIRIDYQYLSRKHLGIQRRDGDLVVRRLPKAQDVSVDGKHLEEGEAIVVNEDSTIGLPGLALKVHLS